MTQPPGPAAHADADVPDPHIAMPAVEASSPPSPRLNLIALALFIFVPFVGAFLGISGGATENELRSDQAFPEILEAPLDEARWAELGRWFEDRLPARGRAIEIEADIARLVDNGNPTAAAESDAVSVGTGGWLFYNQSVHQPCITPKQERALLTEIDLAARFVSSTGRRLVVTIAPDRATVVPERLGDIDAACVIQNRVVVGNLATRPDVVDLADAVHGEEHALKLDTHWAPAGALAASELIVDAIQPGLWDDPELTVTTIDRPGDLQRMVLDDGFEAVELPTFERQSTSQIDEIETSVAGFPMLESLTPGGDELNVVLLHDSYGGFSDPVGGFAVGLAADYVRPWFENFANIRMQPGTEAMAGDPPVAGRIVEADVIALLFVQRSISVRLAPGRIVGPLVSALMDELDPQPITTTAMADGQKTTAAPTGGIIVIDDLAPGTAKALSVAATAGTVLGRVDMTERVVLTVAEGTVLTLGPEARSVFFVPDPPE